MSDLITAVIIVVALSLCILLGTVRLTRPLAKGTTTLIGMVAGVLLLFYLTCLWGQPRLAKLLPYPSLVVLGNWFPFAAAFLAGITWTHGYGSNRRRVLFGTACFGVALYSTIEPLLGSPPHCIDHWSDDGFCQQTTLQTCSAAAAATLLRKYDIDATEAEMTRLCLTRGFNGVMQEGTNWLGLYRGLKLKTAGHRLNVEVFDESFDDFVRNFSAPTIAFVGIPKDGRIPASFTEESGWMPGVRHSVVLLTKLPSEIFVVADPAATKFEFWTIDDLRYLWLGRGVRLMRTNE